MVADVDVFLKEINKIFGIDEQLIKLYFYLSFLH